MPILPRTTKYVELGNLLYECNKRFKDRMFVIDIEYDDVSEKTGRASLDIHTRELNIIKGSKKKIETIIKELMTLLGDYHYGEI